VISAPLRAPNYEIAAYEGLRRMAKAMGEDKAVELLDANLAEEKKALATWAIAARVSNESTTAIANERTCRLGCYAKLANP